MMTEWLTSGTEAQRVHARFRLGLADQTARPSVSATMARIAEIKACRYFARDAECGCAFGKCLETGKPTSFNACDKCLGSRTQGKEVSE